LFEEHGRLWSVTQDMPPGLNTEALHLEKSFDQQKIFGTNRASDVVTPEFRLGPDYQVISHEKAGDQIPVCVLNNMGLGSNWTSKKNLVVTVLWRAPRRRTGRQRLCRAMQRAKRPPTCGADLQRSIYLALITRHQQFDIGLNHGSRSHIGACWLRGIQCVTSYDYEYSSKFLVHQLVSLTLVPDVFEDDLMSSIGANPARVRKYPGLKEELYLASFVPAPEFNLPVPADCILAVIRPPSSTGHYHNPKSEITCLALLDQIANGEDGVVGWVVPRTREEEHQLAERYAHAADKIIIQTKAVNGLDLIWRADLVISGGGTMTREAAVMGVPAYTIFASQLGAVDRYLADNGRLHLIHDSNQVDQIHFARRVRNPFVPPSPKVLNFFIDVLDKEIQADQR